MIRKFIIKTKKKRFNKIKNKSQINIVSESLRRETDIALTSIRSELETSIKSNKKYG